jgi:hypothetical protein
MMDGSIITGSIQVQETRGRCRVALGLQSHCMGDAQMIQSACRP